MYPRKFEDLILAFRKLPGVGFKTAQRYAFEAMKWDAETRKTFIDAVTGIDHIHTCQICGNLSDTEICNICENQNRNHNVICVVQSPKDITAIESTQSYDGVYHVLNGAINTQKGILPDHLNIAGLLRRITDETEEIILATDPTMEGDTTALYLARLLEGKVPVSRLASGIPMGGQLEYTDTKTLQKAMEGRIRQNSEN